MTTPTRIASWIVLATLPARFGFLALGILCLLCLASSRAHAIGDIPISAAVGDQFSPAIVADGAGGAIMVWQDRRGGVNNDIYAQRVDPAGVPQWAAGGVPLCTAGGNDAYVTVTTDGAGGAIATWQDYRSGTISDVYAQRVNAAGAPQWTVGGVALCTAAGYQESVTIVSDGAGGAIVTWQDSRGGTNVDIYAQRVNAAGVPQWTPDGLAVCAAVDQQLDPTSVEDGAGGVMVSWQDYRNYIVTGNADIYAQRIGAAGSPQWTPNGVAVCTAGNYQYDPTIASDGAGGAIVAWDDLRFGVFHDIYAQRVNATGVPQWTADGVTLCSVGGHNVLPKIVPDGAGGAIVTWYRSTAGDIYAQRVNASGAPLWTANGVGVCTAALDQSAARIVVDGAGGAIVCWEDDRNDPYGDIYAQDLNGSGLSQEVCNRP